jgi:hypothetical protein
MEERRLEEDRAFITGLVRDIDPGVRVTVRDYRWRDQWLRDVRLSKGSRTSRLEVTADRLADARHGGEALRHDLEKAVMDLGDEDIGVY